MRKNEERGELIKNQKIIRNNPQLEKYNLVGNVFEYLSIEQHQEREKEKKL